MFSESEIKECNPDLYNPYTRLTRYFFFTVIRNTTMAVFNCPCVYKVSTGCCWMKKKGPTMLMAFFLLDIIVLWPLVIMAYIAQKTHNDELDEKDVDLVLECDDQRLADLNRIQTILGSIYLALLTICGCCCFLPKFIIDTCCETSSIQVLANIDEHLRPTVDYFSETSKIKTKPEETTVVMNQSKSSS